MKTVAIIGGGITGLTAAFRLRRQGIPVTVYESAARVGGAIQTVETEGFLAECGPNTILETSPLIGQLVDDLGLHDRKLYANPNAKERYIARRGKPVALPVSPLGMVRTKLFSANAKWNLLREPFRKAKDDDAEESLADFVVRRLGREFLDYAINPFVAGVYAGDPSRLSVRHAFPKLETLEARYGSLIKGQILGARERKRSGQVSKQNAPMFTFDRGLQVLTDALRTALSGSIRTGARVLSIARHDDQWSVRFVSEGFHETREHSAVLFALPAHQAATIPLQVEGGDRLQWVRQIHYPPVAVVTLGYRREDVAHSLKGFGVLVPEKEKLSILGTFFSSTLFPHRAPTGCVTLTSYIGGTRAPHLVSQPAPELLATVQRDLGTLLGARGTPLFSNISIVPKAIPQYEVGYGRFKQILTDLESSSPGLFFAGHFRDGISIADCIVSGHGIADRIVSAMRNQLIHPVREMTRT